MDKLTKSEIEAFQKLNFDAELKPFFDPMRYCLRWEDEEPECVSKDIYEKYLDLLIARNYIHEGRSRDEWYSLSPSIYFSDFWDHANEVIPNWPGFKRLELKDADRRYLENEKKRDPNDFF